jgi:hypothetical protein
VPLDGGAVRSRKPAPRFEAHHAIVVIKEDRSAIDRERATNRVERRLENLLERVGAVHRVRELVEDLHLGLSRLCGPARQALDAKRCFRRRIGFLILMDGRRRIAHPSLGRIDGFADSTRDFFFGRHGGTPGTSRDVPSRGEPPQRAES